MDYVKRENGAVLVSDLFSIETQALLQGMRSHDPQEYHDKAQKLIQQLEIEIRALKCSCNVVAPIEQLPPEVLSHVFNILRSHSLARGDRNWLASTHVCRRWRAAALDCAELWSCIDFSQNHGMVEAMLKRSKETRLSLEFDARYKPATEKSSFTFRQALLYYAPRLSSVTMLVGCRTAVSRLLASRVFPQHAPILEKIRIEGTFENHELPRKFLQRELPSLRHLTVTGCGIPWVGLPSTPRLTFLKLVNDNNHRPSMKPFLQSLCGMPGLKHLELTDFLPFDAFSLPDPSSLPTLRALVLVDEPTNVPNFFRSCHAIKADQVHLTVNAHHLAELMGVHILGCLEALSQSWKDPTTGAHQTRGGVKALKLTDFNQYLLDPCIECTLQDGSDEPQLILGFRSLQPHPDPLLYIARSLDLSTLHSLTINNCEYISKWFWATVFSPLTKLNTVEFIQSSITTFAGYLNEPHLSLQSYRKPFPSLKLIKSKGSCASDSNNGSSLATLVKLLLAESPCTVQELRISDRSIPEDTYEILESLQGQGEPRFPRVRLENVHLASSAEIINIATLDTGLPQTTPTGVGKE